MGFNPACCQRWVAPTLLLSALASSAGAFELAWPAACALGDTCYIQNYPDHDPSPGATDYTCGPLSYDGHDGTDIALPSRAAMQAGVQVLAAAPGVVKGTRDSVQDFAPKVAGRECGNGLLIAHADGWETQYCHMRQGSVLVHQGDKVDTGTPLGLIGQSGMADFPHLHLTVRHHGADVDPFAPDAPTCATTPGATLWTTSEPYEAGGILAVGFTDAVPEFDAIRAGLPTVTLPTSTPALVIWGFIFGAQTGDVLTLQITEPEGQVLRQDVTLDRTQAQLFRAYGKRVTAETWPSGSYTGLVTLTRKGKMVDQDTVTLTIAP